MLALEQLGDAAGIVDDLDAAAELAHRVVEHLAVLVGQQRDDLVGVLLEQLLEAEHDLGALHRRRVAPGGEGRFGGRDCVFDRGFGRHRDVACHLARCRVRDRQRAVVVGNVLAVDEMADDLGRVNVLCGCGVHVVSC